MTWGSNRNTLRIYGYSTGKVTGENAAGGLIGNSSRIGDIAGYSAPGPPPAAYGGTHSRVHPLIGFKLPENFSWQGTVDLYWKHDNELTAHTAHIPADEPGAADDSKGSRARRIRDLADIKVHNGIPYYDPDRSGYDPDKEFSDLFWEFFDRSGSLASGTDRLRL